MLRRSAVSVLIVAWVLVATAAAGGDEIDEHLRAIATAGPQATGSAAARAACDRLSSCGPEVLPRLLTSMNTPNPVAANWYRQAYEAIVERAILAGALFPNTKLQAMVRDARNLGRVRRLALTLCERLERSPAIPRV
jgi:hypothetical protein